MSTSEKRPLSGLLASRIAESRKRPKLTTPQDRRLCPHCSQNLVMKTFKRHQKLFCRIDGTWITEGDDSSNTESEAMNTPPPTLPTFTIREDDSGTYHLGEAAALDEPNSSGEGDCFESSEEEIWDDDEVDDYFHTDHATETPNPPVFETNSQESQKAASLLLWLVGLLLSLQAKHYIPDSALDTLFKFLYIFLNVIGRFSPFVALLANKFPKSVYIAQRSLGLNTSFTKFVVCPKCWKLYVFEDALQKTGSHETSKFCSFVRYPNHPQRSRREPCNTSLLKSVELLSGRKVLYPYKVFCYKSLKSTLQEFLLRPGFCQDCEHWRGRTACDLVRDIYDGNIWKKFQQVFGSPFLASSFTYALMLNIDWFQPYIHTASSVGVIYLAIMNLPRHLRYKRKNLILIGIIPGPSEPAHDINTILQPLVAELKDLWQGMPFNVNLSSGISEQTIRCALLCVACDLPAGRKVCGFLSHSAAKGCSKCLKSFPGSVGSMCYAGFDRSSWPPRTNQVHRRDVQEIMKCRTKTAMANKESELGCRYSVLLDLPYFDAPAMLTLDPMHNLFLGTGKRMISIWIERGLLHKGVYEQMQHFVDSMNVPCDVGRIPRKIETGFSGFKADQFKTWIILYSIPALFGILPVEHLECWRHFVLACRVLCQQSFSRIQIDLADALLMQFCKRVERLYGEEAISPNIHMHGHLKNVILDYGPMQEFWLFSFERYNGILGKQPSNNKAIEPQLMQRFLRDNVTSSILYPDQFKEDFQPVCESISAERLVGSVLDTVTTTNFKLPMKCTRGVLSSSEVDALKQLYLKHGNHESTTTCVVNSIFLKYSSVTINGKDYRSSGKQTKNPVLALASWDDNLYGDPLTPLPDSIQQHSNVRPVNIHYFMKVSFNINMSGSSFLFAYVSWFYPHPHRHALGKPAELWCHSIFESFGLHSFVPIDHLSCRCAHGVKTYCDEHLLVIVPLVE